MRAIVLAAGHGKRMQSDLPKVLHDICGRPMICYVLDVACEIASGITVVISPTGDAIKDELQVYNNLNRVDFAVQSEQLGTGHATQVGLQDIPDNEDVLVLYGDMPLIPPNFLGEFAKFFDAKNSDAAVVAVHMPQNYDFGYVHQADCVFERIVEQADVASDDDKSLLANTGIYMFKAAALRRGLSKITCSNKQGEYYLTDVPQVLLEEGCRVHVFESHLDVSTFTGVNNLVQLARATKHMRTLINNSYMMRGVRIHDPATTYIDMLGVNIMPGAQILPGCIIEGSAKHTIIGENAIIGPNSHIVSSEIGPRAVVRQSTVVDSKVGADTMVGPFAYLRGSTDVGDACRIGCFVEMKNAKIASKVSAAHLTYLGDTIVGDNVNFGCGVVTCNYDGKNKHTTTIGSGAFVGSNVNFIAPVTVGEGAFVAAGSTITDDIPPGEFSIARARQQNKPARKPKDGDE